MAIHCASQPQRRVFATKFAYMADDVAQKIADALPGVATVIHEVRTTARGIRRRDRQAAQRIRSAPVGVVAGDGKTGAHCRWR